MSLHACTFVVAALLLAYHQATTWLPLYPWNNIDAYSRRELLLEAVWNGALMGLGVLSLAIGNSGFWRY